MTLVLAAALLPVLAYCLVRSLTPARARGDSHRRDVDVWHVLMGLAMVAGLAGLSPGAAAAVLATSALGIGWGVLSVGRPVTGGAAYARLAVGAAAMAVMSIPLALPAQAATAHPAAAMPGMSGMGSSDPGISISLVGVLLLALLVAGTSAAVVAIRRPMSTVRRLDACCDLVMAGVMAVMLAGLL